MTLHGEVKVWHMTESERLEYIRKHPIRPSKAPKGTSYTDINEMQNKREDRRKKAGERAVDKIDKKKAHKMFMAGDTLKSIAKQLKVSQTTLDSFLREQRNLNPEKWPRRQPSKK